MDEFMNAIMNMWPDWAASQGIEPPADGVDFAAGFPGKGGTQPVLPSVDAPVTQPALPPPVAAQSQLPPTETPPPPEPDPSMPTAEQLTGQDMYRMQPTTNEQLFPTDMLQIPQGDINAAASTTPESSPMQAAMGTVLSGLKTPASPQYSQPSAPGIPAIKDINPTLLAVLQAAGLTAPQSPTGLGLGQRIR